MPASRQFEPGKLLVPEYMDGWLQRARLANRAAGTARGIVHVIPTGRGAEIQGVVAHKGNSLALGLDITLYL